jgi:cold shock CspA family protein
MRHKVFVAVGDWVLVSMRDYESDTEHYDRKGEILLKYTAPQVRQLMKAGELPERNAEMRQKSAVAFTDDWTPDDCRFLLQHRDVDVPSDGSDDDDGDYHDAVHDARVLSMHADGLPSPTFMKKSRNRRSRESFDSLVQVDFHHPVGFQPDCCGSVAPKTTAQRSHHVAAPAPPAPISVTIRARVKFWDAAKGMGFATPEDKSQTKAGVDVMLTAECVEGLKMQLLRDDLVEITINPRHDRPYVLNGGLRRV